MTASVIMARLEAAGLRLSANGGKLFASPREAITDELRELIRAHKADLLQVLQAAAGASVDRPDGKTEPPPSVFEFCPPGDPANDDEAMNERAAIMAESNNWNDTTARREARWQADRERCWRAFLRNAQRILEAPEAQRVALLGRYLDEATRQYDPATAADMAMTMRRWVELERGDGRKH